METFPRYWPFVRGIHLAFVPPHKGQWRGALFSFIYAWANNRDAIDWRCRRAHHHVTVMIGPNNKCVAAPLKKQSSGPGPGLQIYSMFKILVTQTKTEDFPETWHLISWPHSLQPIRSNVRKFLLTKLYFEHGFYWIIWTPFVIREAKLMAYFP